MLPAHSRCSSAFILVALLLAHWPADADAARRKAERVVARWDLHVDVEAGSEVHELWEQLSAAVDGQDGIAVDPDAALQPRLRISEGREVALNTAARRLAAAWSALSRGESALVLSFVEEAESAVIGLSPSHLPEGWLRDFVLLRVRAALQVGDEVQAMAQMRRLAWVDPSYAPSPHFESPDFLRLHEQHREELRANGQGTVTLSAPALGLHLLVQGVDKGELLGERGITLPAGRWELCGRKAGYADWCADVVVRPGATQVIEFSPKVENSFVLEDAMQRSLSNPKEARTSPLWDALRIASGHLGLAAVLCARYEDGPTPTLTVGLFVPGRGGWAALRRFDVGETSAEDAAAFAEDVRSIVMPDTTLAAR